MQTILVVDDREKNLIRIEQILSRDYQVIAVNSRAMALKFLNLRLPDLVLVNTEMAGMEGLHLCVDMRENEKWEKIPLDKITSPFDELDIRQRVEKLLFTDIKADDAYLPVISDGKITEVPVEKIECVEMYHQVAIIRMQYQELRTRMTPEHIKKCLGDRFLNVGEWLLVNKKLIRCVSEGILYMKNGREHVLPQSDRKALVEQIKQVLAVGR